MYFSEYDSGSKYDQKKHFVVISTPAIVFSTLNHSCSIKAAAYFDETIKNHNRRFFQLKVPKIRKRDINKSARSKAP